MRGYRRRTRLASKFVAEFEPSNLPLALRDLTAYFFADLWQLLKAIGHPDLPNVHVLKRSDIPWLKVTAATNSLFIIVTVDRSVQFREQTILDTEHHTILLGSHGRAVVVWHHDIAPEEVGRFITTTDEELIAHGVLNSETGLREEGYNYVYGWPLHVDVAFQGLNYIKVRPVHDAVAVWRTCQPEDAVTLVPDYYERTILCRTTAARFIFAPILSQRYRASGKGFHA